MCSDDADNSGSSSQTGSAASSREGSLERCQTVPHSSTSSRITYPVAPLTPSRAGRGSGMDAGECDDVISGVVEEDPILLDPEALKEEIEKDEDILMSKHQHKCLIMCTKLSFKKTLTNWLTKSALVNVCHIYIFFASCSVLEFIICRDLSN